MSFSDLIGKKDRSYEGFIYSFLAVIFLSPVFILMNEAVKSLGLITANVVFFLSGLGSTSIIALITGKMRESVGILKSHPKPVMAVGLINSVQSLLFFFGLTVVGPSAASFIVRMETIFVVILGAVFLKERLKSEEFAGISITFVGAAIMTSGSASFAAGSLILLASTFLLSLQNVIIKKYAGAVKPFALNLGRLAVISVVMLIYSAFSGTLGQVTNYGLIFALAAGIVGPTVGFYFMLKAIEKTEVSKVITIRSLEPFAVIIMSTLFYGASLSSAQILGGLAMIAGIITLVYSHGKHAKK